MQARQIDWQAEADRARGMTDAGLHYARLDAAKTAELWDASDRENGTDVGGFYRDQCSVYAAEQRRRAGR